MNSDSPGRTGGGSPAGDVVRCRELETGSLERLFAGFGIEVVFVGDGEEITGSHWGAPEAGIVGGRLFVRGDTPVHSALHEGCHLVCMGERRRGVVDTDAGGDELEESAVCCLQIALGECLSGVGGARVMADMDRWGYSFRLGSTTAWLLCDAEDALDWLVVRGLPVPEASLRSREAKR